MFSLTLLLLAICTIAKFIPSDEELNTYFKMINSSCEPTGRDVYECNVSLQNNTLRKKLTDSLDELVNDLVVYDRSYLFVDKMKKNATLTISFHPDALQDSKKETITFLRSNVSFSIDPQVKAYVDVLHKKLDTGLCRLAKSDYDISLVASGDACFVQAFLAASLIESCEIALARMKIIGFDFDVNQVNEDSSFVEYFNSLFQNQSYFSNRSIPAENQQPQPHQQPKQHSVIYRLFIRNSSGQERFLMHRLNNSSIAISRLTPQCEFNIVALQSFNGVQFGYTNAPNNDLFFDRCTPLIEFRHKEQEAQLRNLMFKPYLMSFDMGAFPNGDSKEDILKKAIFYGIKHFLGGEDSSLEQGHPRHHQILELFKNVEYSIFDRYRKRSHQLILNSNPSTRKSPLFDLIIYSKLKSPLEISDFIRLLWPSIPLEFSSMADARDIFNIVQKSNSSTHMITLDKHGSSPLKAIANPEIKSILKKPSESGPKRAKAVVFNKTLCQTKFIPPKQFNRFVQHELVKVIFYLAKPSTKKVVLRGSFDDWNEGSDGSHEMFRSTSSSPFHTSNSQSVVLFWFPIVKTNSEAEWFVFKFIEDGQWTVSELYHQIKSPENYDNNIAYWQ